MDVEKKEPIPVVTERKKPKTVKSFVVYIISSSIIVFFFILEFLTGHGHSEEGGSITQNIPITSELSGLNTFVINLYNNNKFLFALAVTVSMAILGLILASLAEIFLRLLGFKVSKISHHE